MITVTIPGRVWFAEALSDPGELDDGFPDDLKALAKTAKERRCGRGSSVTLTGDADTLEHFANWLHLDGHSNAHHCDDEDKPLGRAMMKAAEKIRETIKQEDPQTENSR